MRARSKEATGTALADAFATIEGKDKRVATILGPQHLLDKVRSWSADIYNDKTETLWCASLTADESLDDLYVTDES